MAEPSTIYKLTVLYMLSLAEVPLTNTQLSNFFLEKDYTTYFSLQESLHSLQDSDLILSESTHSNTQYTITTAGRDTLKLLRNKLSPEIENDVKEYLENHKIEFQKENTMLADYYVGAGGVYYVRLKRKEREIMKIDLTLSVARKEIAEAICRNWCDSSEDVYSYLMDLLVQ